MRFEQVILILYGRNLITFI